MFFFFLRDIWLVLLNWPAGIWLSLSVAVAVVAQACITYGILKPKAEVFVRLRREQIQGYSPEVTPKDAKLEIANLSPKGVWVDSVSIKAKYKGFWGERSTKGGLDVLVPGFATQSPSVRYYIYLAFRESGWNNGIYGGEIKLRIRYRENSGWHQTKWESYMVRGEEKGVTDITNPPYRSFRQRVERCLSKTKKGDSDGKT